MKEHSAEAEKPLDAKKQIKLRGPPALCRPPWRHLIVNEELHDKIDWVSMSDRIRDRTAGGDGVEINSEKRFGWLETFVKAASWMEEQGSGLEERVKGLDR